MVQRMKPILALVILVYTGAVHALVLSDLPANVEAEITRRALIVEKAEVKDPAFERDLTSRLMSAYRRAYGPMGAETLRLKPVTRYAFMAALPKDVLCSNELSPILVKVINEWKDRDWLMQGYMVNLPKAVSECPAGKELKADDASQVLLENTRNYNGQTHLPSFPLIPPDINTIQGLLSELQLGSFYEKAIFRLAGFANARFQVNDMAMAEEEAILLLNTTYMMIRDGYIESPSGLESIEAVTTIYMELIGRAPSDVQKKFSSFNPLVFSLSDIAGYSFHLKSGGSMLPADLVKVKAFIRGVSENEWSVVQASCSDQTPSGMRLKDNVACTVLKNFDKESFTEAVMRRFFDLAEVKLAVDYQEKLYGPSQYTKAVSHFLSVQFDRLSGFYPDGFFASALFATSDRF